MKKKVIIGMSGGVDSSVAAALLIEQGYEVIGVTMNIWSQTLNKQNVQENAPCSLSAVEDARRVANVLGIPHYVMNFQEIFKEKVINYFIKEYKRGRTPNPCIACNKFIKFDALLKKAIAMDADYIATGHYAKVEYDDKIRRYLLKKSITVEKDQTYALYNLKQSQLKHILMPLGNYNKDKTRNIAKNLDLKIASKPDSQEICFIPDNNYAGFIEQRIDLPAKTGNFIDIDGKVLGKHKGIINYTIGQRRGLGLALGKPMYVIKINAETNTVILGEEDQQFNNSLTATNLNFIPFDKLENDMKVGVKIRYSAKEAEATISPYKDDQVFVKFAKAQKAITPGQAVVFYDDENVIGGGTIAESGSINLRRSNI